MKQCRNVTMKRGFTLTELLVVAGIIIFLSAAILVNYRGYGQEFTLQRAAHQLARDIRKAGEMAMSAKEFAGSIPPGYGIFLTMNDNYYILYADTYPAGGSQQYEGGDGLVETIYLETGVYIKNLSLPSSLSINFKPPSPTIRIQAGDTALITLALTSDSTKTKVVRVNTAGLIEVE